jgi:hypothetical protein
VVVRFGICGRSAQIVGLMRRIDFEELSAEELADQGQMA